MANQKCDLVALSEREARAKEHHFLKRFAKSVEILRGVLAMRLILQGDRHFQTINARSGLARSLRAIHQYDECFMLYSENIRIHTDKLGPDHPQTLRSLSRLANTYFAAGQYENARPMFVGILASRIKVLGRDHPDTLRSRSSLANTLSELGMYRESAVLHQEIIDDRVRVLGPDHPRTQLSRLRFEIVRKAIHSA